ncbi:hypothetical protein ACTQ34_16390, partial [Agathobaculum sp. LCP25S3_E8]|uniref:hypothetical protein n=1 Tax=Agathobaculum sp. LCP25S3_E8 TaxID=3438735 RepID=UPI003F92AFB5
HPDPFFLVPALLSPPIPILPRSNEKAQLLLDFFDRLSCLFLLETDSFCSLTVALHTRICQPTVKIRITSLSLLSQWLQGFFSFSATPEK